VLLHQTTPDSLVARGACQFDGVLPDRMTRTRRDAARIRPELNAATRREIWGGVWSHPITLRIDGRHELIIVGLRPGAFTRLG